MGCSPEIVDGIAARLGTLNDAILDDRTLGEQFQVGHSFVTPLAAPGPADADWRDWFIETVGTEVGPLLREYWYDRPDEAENHISKLQAGL
jgi:5-methylcytosine-specific restriction protein B